MISVFGVAVLIAGPGDGSVDVDINVGGAGSGVAVLCYGCGCVGVLDVSILVFVSLLRCPLFCLVLVALLWPCAGRGEPAQG